MKTLLRFITCVLPLIFLMISSTLFAHTAVTVTEPKNGAVLSDSPEKLLIRFSDEAYLNSIAMFDSENKAVPLTFTVPEALARRFSIPVPALNKGRYTVIWSAEGTDTHKINGELSFSIE